MNILAWIVFGLITGVVANIIHVGPSKGGIFGAIILGIVGAVVGGFIGKILLGVGVTGFNITSFLVAIGGAVLLLLAARSLKM
jgi:uncharacterized membrane protein YeaQ/YmgE (transglycosylase-associated protein family)